MFLFVKLFHIQAKMESCENHERCRHREHGASVLLRLFAATEEIWEGRNGLC